MNTEWHQRGLVEEALTETREAAVDDITDEIRVARLIAHMRPYLISAYTPAPLRIPVQRTATHRAERDLEQRLARHRADQARNVRRVRRG